MVTALEIAEAKREGYVVQSAQLCDRLIAGVLDLVTGATLTGHPTRRLPNDASFCS